LRGGGRTFSTFDFQVCHEESGQRVHLITGTTVDGNSAATHVELTVAKSVLPRPGKDSVAGVHALRNRDIPGMDTNRMLV
jgi:hypothetical protein